MEQKFCNIKGSEDCPHNCGNALLSWGDNECRLFSPHMALQATRKAARGCQFPFVRGTRFFLRNVDDPLFSLQRAAGTEAYAADEPTTDAMFDVSHIGSRKRRLASCRPCFLLCCMLFRTVCL